MQPAVSSCEPWSRSECSQLSVLPLNPGVGQNVASCRFYLKTLEQVRMQPAVGSTSKPWSRSKYSHACVTHCQQFISNFYLSDPYSFTAGSHVSVFSLGYLGMANTGPCVGPHSKIGCPSLSYHHKHFTQQECKQASKLQLVKDIDRQSCVVCIATDCE